MNTFKEIYRILKPNGKGKMVISDRITSREIDPLKVDDQNWCNCIDGALTKKNYIDAIERTGFSHVHVLDEKPYMELDIHQEIQEKRKICSILIRAVKK